MRDFCDTKFPDGSFDVVWALESVCHAERKIDFLREAYRVLKPGGRLIVSDGYIKKKDMSSEERKQVNTRLNGWAVETKNLATVDGFSKDVKKTGFTHVVVEDATLHVVNFSRWLYTMAKWALPFLVPLHWLGIFSKTQIDNGISAMLQYPLLKQGVWTYMIYTGIKPNRVKK